jgi:hypothetical protein
MDLLQICKLVQVTSSFKVHVLAVLLLLIHIHFTFFSANALLGSVPHTAWPEITVFSCLNSLQLLLLDVHRNPIITEFPGHSIWRVLVLRAPIRQLSHWRVMNVQLQKDRWVMVPWIWVRSACSIGDASAIVVMLMITMRELIAGQLQALISMPVVPPAIDLIINMHWGVNCCLSTMMFEFPLDSTELLIWIPKLISESGFLWQSPKLPPVLVVWSVDKGFSFNSSWILFRPEAWACCLCSWAIKIPAKSIFRYPSWDLKTWVV